MKFLNWRYKKKYKEWMDFQPNLKVADILFFRRRGGFISWLIRKFTKSYWSHVALVFAVPNKKKLFNNYLIIEADRYGLLIHRIQEYTSRLDIYDIGVKRVQGLSREERERVVAFMLNNVDKEYDLTRTFGFFLKSFDWDLTKGLTPMFVDKEDFVCSTFIQKAFYQAADSSKKLKVVFNDDLKLDSKGNLAGASEIEKHLDYVTPKDVAKSKKAVWLFNKHY